MKRIFFIKNVIFLVAILVPLSSGQSGDLPKQSPVQISVKLKNVACVGEPFTLMARLTNTGERDYIIDPVGIWMSFRLTANDRSTQTISISGKAVPVPDSTLDGGMAPPVSSGRLKRRLVSLMAGESYTSEKEFDPSRDLFFITPGRYTIDLTYAPALADPMGYGGLSGSVIAEPLDFTIRRCE